MEPTDSQNDRKRPGGVDVGMAIVWGALAGTIVFALTGNAIWIALGAAIGVVVGAVTEMRRRR